MVKILDESYFRYSGRILKKNDIAYMGYTNSSVEFYVQGIGHLPVLVSALIETKLNGEENYARIRVYIDEQLTAKEPVVLDEPLKSYELASIQDNHIHKITIIKISEAAMSYCGLHSISISNGQVLTLPSEEDSRVKALFIGDSITCGYGIHGEPESEYHIRDEDGMASYAYLTAEKLHLNAQYFSVSGYGMYCEYTGDTNGTIPRVFPYTNWWIDPNEKYNFTEFIPELIVINLGTNDSGHLSKKGISEKFTNSYVRFLETLHTHFPSAKILCICGTLCTESFVYIEKACRIAREQGIGDIYCYELPYHDVEHDGKASNHPSAITHQKDAARLVNKIKELHLI